MQKEKRQRPVIFFLFGVGGGRSRSEPPLAKVLVSGGLVLILRVVVSAMDALVLDMKAWTAPTFSSCEVEEIEIQVLKQSTIIAVQLVIFLY